MAISLFFCKSFVLIAVRRNQKHVIILARIISKQWKSWQSYAIVVGRNNDGSSVSKENNFAITYSPPLLSLRPARPPKNRIRIYRPTLQLYYPIIPLENACYLFSRCPLVFSLFYPYTLFSCFCLFFFFLFISLSATTKYPLEKSTHAILLAQSINGHILVHCHDKYIRERTTIEIHSQQRLQNIYGGPWPTETYYTIDRRFGLGYVRKISNDFEIRTTSLKMLLRRRT